MTTIFVNSRKGGQLNRASQDRRNFIFAYDDGATPNEAVSLTMPVMREQYPHARALHPIFDMNLPEGEFGARLSREFSKTVEHFDELTLLEIVGRSQIGRLHIGNAPASPEETAPVKITELLSYDGTADLFESLLQKYGAYSGVSGVQPKVLVRDESPLNRITQRDATHIIKSWNADEFPQLAANEFFCMQAARLAEIPTAACSLSQNAKYLVLERFDRTPNGAYLGFEDFCVLNGVTSRYKYTGSYEKIAKRIRDFISPEHIAAALQQLLETLALSCVVRNGDAHLKNFGVLYTDPSSPVVLAPAYDIVTTTAYVPNDGLALTLGGSKRFAQSKALRRFAIEHCELRKKRIDEIFERLQVAVTQTAGEMEQYAREHPEFRETGARMKRIWTEGIEQALRD